MSLAKYKRDKITEALLDKGYQRHPEREFEFGWLWLRFIEEVEEISQIEQSDYDITLLEVVQRLEDDIELFAEEHGEIVIDLNDDFFEKLKRELADISNFTDYLFDRLLLLERVYYLHKDD